MSQKNLKQKAASGMIWAAIQKYSTMGIQFISGIILARLLTPYDYGCIGMLAIFMALAETFVDGGFGSALIQKKNPTQDDYSTIFYWNIAMAAIMYVVLFLCAPAIARFFEIPLLSSVLRVQGLVLFIYAFNLVQRNQLKKKLNFKFLSIVTITTSFIALGITIFMAYKGFGVWALVVQNLVASAIPALVFWFYVRWRPRLVFSWKSFKELFGFGFYMFLTHMVDQFATKISGLLIGKIYSPTTMGYYSKAMNVERLASHSVSSIMMNVSYPLYAQVQDDLAGLANMIKRISASIAYITFPIMFILLLTAKPIFVLLYSERWLESVPYFQVLCLVGLASCMASANLQSIAAIGKSKTMFKWTLIKRTTGLVFVVGGLFLWGMKGLLLGTVIFNWSCYFVNIGLVSKHIHYKWYRQLIDLMPIGIVSALAAIVSYFVGYFLNLDMYLDGLVKLVVYLIIYVGWSLAFKPECFKFFLSLVPEKFKIFKKEDNN